VRGSNVGHYIQLLCTTKKEVTGSRGRAPGQGVRAEAETLLAFRRSMEDANVIFGNAKSDRGHFVTIKISPGG